MARTALPHVVEGTLLPLAIFYLAMWLLGIWGAIALSLAWSWGAVAVRVVKRRRIPGILLLGAVALTARSLVSVVSGSVFVYFLQPTLGTVVLAGAFLLSAPAGKPLAARLAEDFLPMPDWFSSHPTIRRFFVRMTVLWGAIQLANAAVAFWLLVTQPIEIYLAAKTAASGMIMVVAIGASVVWFRRLVAHHGLHAAPHPEGA
jgi:hypothetical protein